MTGDPTVHAFVFCWPGKEDNAHQIAEALYGFVERLTVLFKNDTGVEETGPGEWRRIPSERYYGWQFRESLKSAEGDIILQIQADASHEDWPDVVARCRQAFTAHPSLGIWSPNVWHSLYTPSLVRSTSLEGEDLVTAILTDGVVWALAAPVAARMRELDYSSNNIGWGLTEVAAAVAVTSGLLVAMDTTCKVHHPLGSGYDRARAVRESAAFTSQLSAVEMSYVRTSQLLIHYRLEANKMRRLYHRALLLTPGYWRSAFQRLRGRVAVPAPEEATYADQYRMLI